MTKSKYFKSVQKQYFVKITLKIDTYRKMDI